MMASEAKDWLVAEGESEGLPLILRLRSLQNEYFAARPDAIVIRWEFDQRSESGLPDTQQQEVLDHFEDLLEMMEDECIAELVAVLTTGWQREYYLYSSSLDAFSRAFHALPQEEERYPIKIEAASGDRGVTYFELRESVEG